MANMPTPSSFRAIGKISDPRSLPPSSDWLPSRNVVSVSRSGGLGVVASPAPLAGEVARSAEGVGGLFLALWFRAIGPGSRTLAVGQRLALLEVAARDVGVGHSEHSSREPRGVPGARLADRHRR